MLINSGSKFYSVEFPLKDLFNKEYGGMSRFLARPNANSFGKHSATPFCYFRLLLFLLIFFFLVFFLFLLSCVLDCAHYSSSKLFRRKSKEGRRESKSCGGVSTSMADSDVADWRLPTCICLVISVVWSVPLQPLR